MMTSGGHPRTEYVGQLGRAGKHWLCGELRRAENQATVRSRPMASRLPPQCRRVPGAGNPGNTKRDVKGRSGIRLPDKENTGIMKITRILSHSGAYAVACTILFASSSLAEPILFGQASIDGAVTVTNTTVSFSANNGGAANAFNIDSYSGSFATLTGGSIQNLINGPVTGNTSIPGFATFQTTAGLITFDVNHIDPGTGTSAACSDNTVGSVCTPAGSPFTLTQGANGVSFTFSVEGIAYTGMSSGGDSPADGLFTGQQVPGTITEVLGTLASNGGTGSFSNSYSASFSADAPEPGTFATFLIGAGLLGMGVIRSRRQRC